MAEQTQEWLPTLIPGVQARATPKAGAAPRAVLGAGFLATGLLAGFFYSYSVSVMPGLRAADDGTLVDAMQQINEAVQNPVFFFSFMGAPLLTGAASVLVRRSGARGAARWIGAAAALCGVAVLVGFGVNIPLNDELARAGDPARIADMAAVRDAFEDKWVAWNVVRTLASTAALGCAGYALLLFGRETAATRGGSRAHS